MLFLFLFYSFIFIFSGHLPPGTSRSLPSSMAQGMLHDEAGTQLLTCQCLYLCTNRASKLSTCAILICQGSVFDRDIREQRHRHGLVKEPHCRAPPPSPPPHTHQALSVPI